MDIVIQPLTPALSADYFDFFEHRAFTDDSPYRCYCQQFQMTSGQAEAAYRGVSEADIGLAARRVAEEQIADRRLRGYLAYMGGVCIGWCNANDREHYPADSPDGARLYAPPEKRERAAACFEIAPEYRGKGVATALLARVVRDAQIDGRLAVEGYPIIRSERFEWDYTGPVRLYEKAGFRKIAERDGYIVMRRDL